MLSKDIDLGVPKQYAQAKIKRVHCVIGNSRKNHNKSLPTQRSGTCQLLHLADISQAQIFRKKKNGHLLPLPGYAVFPSERLVTYYLQPFDCDTFGIFNAETITYVDHMKRAHGVVDLNTFAVKGKIL